MAQHLDPNRESHLQEILARKSPLPVKGLVYTVGLIGGRLGHYAERYRPGVELREAEERVRLATEAGHVGLLDWDLLADEIRCSGAMTEIYGCLPLRNGG